MLVKSTGVNICDNEAIQNDVANTFKKVLMMQAFHHKIHFCVEKNHFPTREK